MQKAKRARDANYQKMIFLGLFMLIGNTAFCQVGYDQFRKNFSKVLLYPRPLIDSCTPAYANLLIDIDNNGKIAELDISDSAPSILKDKFNLIKGKLKPELLYDYVKTAKLKNCGILIPVFFIFANQADYCGNSFDDKIVDNKYFIFNTKAYKKLVLPFEPIITRIYKPVR